MIRASFSLALSLAALALGGCQSGQPQPPVIEKSKQARQGGAVVRYYQGAHQSGGETARPATTEPSPPLSAEPSYGNTSTPSTSGATPKVRVYQTQHDSPAQPQPLAPPATTAAARAPEAAQPAPAPTASPPAPSTPSPAARPDNALQPDEYRQLADSFIDDTAAEYQQTLVQLRRELAAYKAQLNQLMEQASRYWGQSNLRRVSAKHFVKYTDNYRSRGEMDFHHGRIYVETVAEGDYRSRLHQAIVATLLTPDNARDPKLFSAMNIDYQGPSVLAGQVRDHEGVPVRWRWRANRYANYLVEHKLQRVEEDGHTLYRIEIPMVQNHVQVRGQKYETLVRKYARKYNISETLIYGIMETESSFNPYAMSSVPAYGLMQVVPATAGRDVFQRLKQRNDQPDKNYLFNAENNIDTGTGYLTILRDIYLKDVRHPLSKEYCMISAYNGGAGNVMRIFSKDRKEAVRLINQLTPQQVYQKLRKQHPSAEARRYLYKVVTAKRKYETLAQQSGGNTGA